MEVLFLLAEKLVHQIKCSFLNEYEKIGDFYFQESVIKDSSFKIFFSDGHIKIILFLSLNHLDMPWGIEVSIFNEGQEINFNNLILDERKCESIYSTPPNLLRDPNGLGENLAKELSKDLIWYLTR